MSGKKPGCIEIGFRTMTLNQKIAVLTPALLMILFPLLLDAIMLDNKNGGGEFLVIYSAIKHITPILGGIALGAGVLIMYIRGKIYMRRYLKP